LANQSTLRMEFFTWYLMNQNLLPEVNWLLMVAIPVNNESDKNKHKPGRG